MNSSVERPVRSSLILAMLALTLILVACASAAAHSPASGTNATPPTAPGVTEPGGSGGSSGNGQPGDPGGTVTSPPIQPGPFPGDGASHVTPVAGVKDAHPASIDHISVAPDGVTVTIYWYGGVESCYALSHVLVTRDADGVPVITVLQGTRPGLDANTACIEIAQLKATTITLDAPLFRDGSTPRDQ